MENVKAPKRPLHSSKTLHACGPCYKAKTRCDGRRPCERCFRLGRPTFCEDKREKRSRSRRMPHHLQSTAHETSLNSSDPAQVCKTDSSQEMRRPTLVTFPAWSSSTSALLTDYSFGQTIASKQEEQTKMLFEDVHKQESDMSWKLLMDESAVGLFGCPKDEFAVKDDKLVEDLFLEPPKPAELPKLPLPPVCHSSELVKKFWKDLDLSFEMLDAWLIHGRRKSLPPWQMLSSPKPEPPQTTCILPTLIISVDTAGTNRHHIWSNNALLHMLGMTHSEIQSGFTRYGFNFFYCIYAVSCFLSVIELKKKLEAGLKGSAYGQLINKAGTLVSVIIHSQVIHDASRFVLYVHYVPLPSTTTNMLLEAPMSSVTPSLVTHSPVTHHSPTSSDSSPVSDPDILSTW
eukprot:g33877.t1